MGDCEGGCTDARWKRVLWGHLAAFVEYRAFGGFRFRAFAGAESPLAWGGRTVTCVDGCDEGAGHLDERPHPLVGVAFGYAFGTDLAGTMPSAPSPPPYAGTPDDRP